MWFVAATMTTCTEPEPVAMRERVLELPALPYNYMPLMVADAIPTLGRVLFYDQQLSLNNTISCSSCHKQNLAFSDNVRFSRGFENKLTARNSMPIQNLMAFGGFIALDAKPLPPDVGFVPSNFGSHLFWDGRETDLKKMVLRPMVNHVEMGITDVEALSDKLSEIPYYQDLFTKAYGDSFVTKERVSEALGWFLSSINSNNTRLDKSLRSGESLSALEMKGQMLFITKYDCNSCHGVQFTNGYAFLGTFANIGLDAAYSDDGLSKVTKRSGDAGKFKVPSLRNVELTAPYMHDGRFESLEEVIDHYSEGIADHPNLDKRLKDESGAPRRMDITEPEKDALIAFLRTLTDEEMIRDPRFSDPFKIQ